MVGCGRASPGLHPNRREEESPYLVARLRRATRYGQFRKPFPVKEAFFQWSQFFPQRRITGGYRTSCRTLSETPKPI